MSETYQIELPSQLAANDLRGVDRASEAEKIANLAKLASIAAESQDASGQRLQVAGFQRERYYAETEGALARIDQHSNGPIMLQTRLLIPTQISTYGATNAQLQALLEEYQIAKCDEKWGAIRFACGRLWYTFKHALTRELSDAIVARFALDQHSNRDEIERQLHFHFQMLYQKPPDSWDDLEKGEWGFLASILDVDQYQKDNPPTDHRIGKLLRASADFVTIQWNSEGQRAYDSRGVPADLLTARIGSLVFAEFSSGNKGEVWLSTRIEPPMTAGEIEYESESSDAQPLISMNLPVADWPKVER